MDKPLRVLIVEDSEDDALLVLRELNRGGYNTTFERVETAEAMTAALNKQAWDIIISDYHLPHFSAPAALELFKNTGLDLPYIVISGTIGEETAVEMMKAGAHDYLMKDNLTRLVPAIEREIHEAEEREKRRQAEEELVIAEQNFHYSLDNSPLGICIVTAGGETIYANRTILDIYGYTSIEELRNTAIDKRYTPDSYTEFQKRREQREQDEPALESYELSIVRKDGQIRHLLTSRKAVVWNGELQFQVTYQDITERREMEETLWENEERYRAIFEQAADSIVLIDLENRMVVDFNDIAYNNLGYSKEEFSKLKLSDIDVNESDEVIMGRLNRILEGEINNFETQHRTKSGEIRDMFIRSRAIHIGGKDFALSIWQDITERKQAEETIKRAAEEWRTTFDSITDLVSINDTDFKITRVNTAFAAAANMNPQELIGKPCYQVIHGTDEPIPNCPHMKTLETKEPTTGDFFEPHLGMYLEVATSPVFNDNGEIIASVHVARDITERRKMEEQLIVTDRLASIGELSSGIAHELNNPLTSVIGFSDLLLDKGISDDIREDVEIINREAKRTAEIVRNLLTFARKHEAEEKPVNMNNIIEKVLELRAYEQKVSNIEVNTQFAPDLPEITADGFRLQQVFINLIINAEHFMAEAHGRGTLTITTERIGDTIRASFTDDGPGIAQENLRHLFDPFFTTKEVGKGTGLGLSISYGIITQHDGRIYAESELGKGATFIIELPIKNNHRLE